MPTPVVIDTIAAQHADGYTLHGYCWRCQRRAEIDLAALIAAGQGERRPPLYARCKVCGERGQLQRRVPQADWSKGNPTGWR